MTEKLYYKNSHMREFSARVISCEPCEGGYSVILDRTAFFPVGGGQAADRGTIDGAAVLSAREQGEDVAHLTDSPLAAGSRVRGYVDWETRFRRMQNHSGEHVVSGTVHSLHGYDNVGFHMGERCVTLDFNGELSREELRRVELIANMTIWRDRPVTACFPAPEELSAMDYRCKKELEGPVRIVTIEGVDRCACCAPHVSRTGEIGMIKILSAERHRGGMRLTMVCGRDALEDYELRCGNISEISALLSAKPLSTAEAVGRVLAELESEKRRADAAALELMRLEARLLPETEGCLCVFKGPSDLSALRELVNEGMKKSRLCAAFAGEDGDWKYIIGSERVDLKSGSGDINAAINGKGGGSASMIQGTSAASRGAIEAYFAENVF